MNKLDVDYQNLVRDILENGSIKSDRTLTGTKSVFGRTIRHRMSDGFPLLTTKKMAWKTMVTELLWFLRGDTNIKYLVDNDCNIWNGDAYKRYVTEWCKKNKAPEKLAPSQTDFINLIKTDDEFAKKWGELGKIYGKQWRSWGYDSDEWREEYKQLQYGSKEEIEHLSKRGIDQIANAIHLLKTAPDSRRILVSAWNVADLPDQVLPPCHYSFQFYTRELSDEERIKLYEQKTNTDTSFFPILRETLDFHNIPKRAISLSWQQRSVDVGLGLPFNIASYALLLEIIAKEVNMIPEEVIGNLGDCHIYLNHIDGLKEQLTRTPYELPKLDKLPDYLCEDAWECYEPNDIKILNYQSHPAIKLPLSN